jgi:hypothetical protein
MSASWRTTLSGICTILVAFVNMIAMPYLDSDPATLPNWGGFIALLMPAIGLLMARDHKVTSEAAGAK